MFDDGDEQVLREKLERAHAALRGLLAEPYGCSLCDSGKTRNPVKGHQLDCPYEIARTVLEDTE